MEKEKLILNYIPTIGLIFFILIFIYSSTLYPGGSQANISSSRFDWINNYWCNLMMKIALNGKINPARPYAISGMVILCFSVLFFFFQFASILLRKNI